MAGRKTIALTERQFAVLQLFWKHGPMTVRELMAHLPGATRMPYTTVLGLLQHMEKAGLVVHTEEGPSYRYDAAVSRQEATSTLLGDFVRRFFQGSARALVLGLVDTEQLSPEALREIEEQLRQADVRAEARAKTQPRSPVVARSPDRATTNSAEPLQPRRKLTRKDRRRKS